MPTYNISPLSEYQQPPPPPISFTSQGLSLFANPFRFPSHHNSRCGEHVLLLNKNVIGSFDELVSLHVQSQLLQRPDELAEPSAYLLEIKGGGGRGGTGSTR